MAIQLQGVKLEIEQFLNQARRSKDIEEIQTNLHALANALTAFYFLLDERLKSKPSASNIERLLESFLGENDGDYTKQGLQRNAYEIEEELLIDWMFDKERLIACGCGRVHFGRHDDKKTAYHMSGKCCE